MRVLAARDAAGALADGRNARPGLDAWTMTRRVATRLRVDCPPTELVDLLATRPSGWLRPFFVLATVEGHAPATRAAHHPWHRLGAAIEDGSSIQYALVWRPGSGERLFSRFRGVLAVDGAEGTGAAVLSLEGECEGGDADANAAVIAALLRLLATAVGADYELVG